MLSITPFLCKYVTLLLKNSSCTLLGQEHHLFQGTVSFLILRNLKPKETKRNKKNKHKKRNTVFQTCLNMPIQIQVVPKTLFFFGGVINHSKLYFHQKRLVHGRQKANMVLDHVMYLGKQIAFTRPQQACPYFQQKKGLCMDNKKYKIM